MGIPFNKQLFAGKEGSYMYQAIQKVKNMQERLFVILFLLSVFLLNALLGVSGIDMTDEGFLLSAYQQMFNNPQSTGMMSCYNTLLLGGLWNVLFGKFGIIGFRIFAALLMTIISAFVYYLCRDVVGRWWIFIGLIMVFLGGKYIFVFHYNHTSALVSIITAFFTYKSVTKNNVWYMLMAGVSLGFGVLFRVPNICMCAFILILIPYYLHTRNFKLLMRLFGSAVLGFVIGMVINLGLVVALGHQEYLIASFTGLFVSLDSTEDKHGLMNLIITYVDQFKSLLRYMSIIAIWPILLWLVCKYETNHLLKRFVVILLSVCFVYTLYDLCSENNAAAIHLQLLYPICCAMLLLTALKRREDAKVHYLVTLSFLTMFVLPLGSDYGVHTVGAYSMYLAMPLAIGSLWKEIHLLSPEYKRVFKPVTIIGMLLIVALTTYYSLRGCYRDSGFRFRMTATVKESVVPTTLTKPERSLKLDTVLMHIKPYVNSQTQLLAYPGIPMINYMSGTIPYLDNSWIGIVPYEIYRDKLNYASSNKELPIIVIAKTPRYWYVPNENWHSVLDCKDWHPSIEEKNILLDKFINDHQYRIEYDDGCFQVLIPDHRK